MADLVAIAVRPEYQTRGVGQRLLTGALETASHLVPAVDRLWLVVADGNARAQRLFSRNGFRAVDGVGVYPGGQRALRMVKPMGDASS